MSSQTKSFITPEEYLAIERKAETRSEYFDGEMFPMNSVSRRHDSQSMTAASRRHNLIAGNIFAALHRQLSDRPCEVYASDMRVRVPATGLYTYPDIAVACEEPQAEDSHFDTLLNPVMIVEVLSDSTEAYDRGKKFEHYQRIESLKEYVLVAQEPYRIEQFVRQSAAQWLYSEARRPEDIIKLSSIECELALKDIYAKVS
ncbi:MAG: Uma2 family endonuclease [Pyrinomonadaceae bacterium]|nr:Uma2 family endonuclease [Pyrinomonadaceae bacterium]